MFLLAHDPHLALGLTVVLVAAFAAGFMNAVAGGGTFLTFPALTGIAKLNEQVANMTSTIGLVPGSATSIYAAREDLARVPRNMLIAYGIVSLIGGGLGSLLLIFTSNKTFIQVIPWLLAFATIIFAFSKPIARWAGRKHGHRSLKWSLLVGLIQFFVAIYGGYFGAGMGVLMLASLSFAGLDDLHQTNALKVLLGMFINGTATIIFCFSLMIRWEYALPMTVTSSIGGFLGIRFARSIKADSLRMIILAIGVLLTAAYAYNAYKAAHG
jgi:hypothetical protein